MENMKQSYVTIGLLYLSNQEKSAAKFAVQVCGSKKLFVVVEVPKIIANVPQTCDLRLRTTHSYFAELAVAE